MRTALVLLTVLAISGIAAASDNYQRWTNATGNGDWNDVGNWVSDATTTPTRVPTNLDWVDLSFEFAGDPVNGFTVAGPTNLTIPAGNYDIWGLSGPNYNTPLGADPNAPSGTLTIADGANIYVNGGVGRFGWRAGSAAITQNGGSVYVYNGQFAMPRAAGTGVSGLISYDLNAGYIRGGQLLLAPGESLLTMSAGTYAIEDTISWWTDPLLDRMNRLQSFIDDGLIVGDAGVTSLQISVLTGQGYNGADALRIDAVPEPATMALLALGGLVGLRRRK